MGRQMFWKPGGTDLLSAFRVERSRSMSQGEGLRLQTQGHELADQAGDFVGHAIQREVAGIENMHFRIGNILAVSPGFTRVEREIVLSP